MRVCVARVVCYDTTSSPLFKRPLSPWTDAWMLEPVDTLVFELRWSLCVQQLARKRRPWLDDRFGAWLAAVAVVVVVVVVV